MIREPEIDIVHTSSMQSIEPQSLDGVLPEDMERIEDTLERTRYAMERHEDYAESFVVVNAII